MAVHPPGGVAVGLAGARGMDGELVQRDPDLRQLAQLRPQRAQREAVGEQQVVRRTQRGGPVADPRRLGPVGVTEEGHDPRLVVGDPLRHGVPQLRRDERGVLGEAVRGVALAPAAAVLQRLRQIPVVERRDGLDPALEQAFGQPPVEVEARRVGRPAARRLHPRPGDREAVALEAQLGHQIQVGLPAAVVVARRLARVAVGHRARRRAEAIPDRLAAAVGLDRALDLERRRRRPEAHGRWEGAGVGLATEVQDLRVDRRHPLTAPAVMPRTSQRCAAKKAMTTGIVEITPAAMSCP